MKRVTRHKSSALNLPTLRLEGGLFLPDVLEKAALGTARLQADADYGIPKGLKQKDEYSRAFQIASAQWKHFEKQMERTDLDANHATATFVAELLRDALAYPAVGASTGISVGDRHYPVTHIASNGLGAQLPILVAPHTQGLDEADARFGVRHTDGQAIGGHSGTRKKSPFQLAQELLNASPDHQWAIVTNGKTIRILRDAATLTRPSYLDIDIADLLSGQRYAEFAYAWRLLHASRAGLQATNDITVKQPVVWETWREAGQEEGTRVRNGLRLGVTQALLTFGNGFLQHPANDALRMALQNGELKKEDYFAQLLRLIYRLIFVFSIEERGLLKDANGQTNAAYTQGYALARLRDMALRRRARNRFDDLWQSMRIVFKGLNLGEPRLGLPALGGLFNTSQCPALDGAELSNAHLLATMQSMRWAAQAGGSLAPIDYRNMGVEELGSVYESLLELVPEVDLPARSFGFVGLTSEGTYVASVAGNERKLTGSYYTPDSLVQELIQSALVPVIDERIAAQPDNPVEALLSIKVCDPACGSGHFLLAAARKLAERLAALRSDDGVVTPSAYRHALREVIARCIYGVDRNPMAIELARTALWLEGFEEGRPLSFLDHHLQVGDALLGLVDLNVLQKGLSGEAFKQLTGDDKEVCKALSKINLAALKQLEREQESGQLTLDFSHETGLQSLKAIESMAAETPEQISEKERAYLQFLEHSQDSTIAHAADLFVAAYLAPKTAKNLAIVPTTASLILELSAQDKDESHHQQVAAARKACKAARVLHWPLAFPQVFAAGGFDCLLGNPPWEMLQLDPQEFFASRAPEIANAQHMAARDKMIEDLRASNPKLHAEYFEDVRRTEASQAFVHVSGRFPASGFGRLNLAYLFAELFLDLKKAIGRSGVVVPSGIATDSFSQHLFNKIAKGNLVSFFDIENSQAIFEGVHRSYKFCLLTLGNAEEAQFACFISNTSQLTDARRIFRLAKDDFELLNPNTGTCPVFRSNQDAELTKKIYRRVPVLWREASDDRLEVNPWGLKFMLMFMMNTDSGKFRNREEPGTLPLFEAKLIHQFDHRWATYTPDGNVRDMSLAEKQDPVQTARPRYWVDEREVLARVANVPARLAKAWLLTHAEGPYSQSIPEAKSLEFAVASWVAGQLMREAVYNTGQAVRTVDTLSKNELAQALHGAQSVIEERYPPLAETLRAAGIEGAAARKAFAAWCEDDREVPLSQLELDEIDAWMRVWNGLSSEGTRVGALLTQVDVWMQRRSPKWLMGWRRNARATDERTTIATVMPLSGQGDSMFLWTASTAIVETRSAALLANLGSLIFDFVARQKVGGVNFSFYYFKQLPVFPPEIYTEKDLLYIVPRVLELTYTALDLAAWAQDLGYTGQPFPFNPERRAQLRAELDAYYARLYGLTRDELRYILDPADVMGDDYPSETFRVLKKGEVNEFGYYRTQRLVLEAWDRLTQTGDLH
ncbi:Eco57I restriction-modification methylase domain-containing protein [Limnohabitans sp.]|uniref:Eco57I restriction-modification methylase domain-containing protein n=1 Tax=Limnohabitans sp. TaxID=1907725 RepID=UPI00286F74B6|nr:N-6 DNA methylase [Limnohabitans sp.]